MNARQQRTSKLAYLVFLIPPILAFLSWQYFPVLAEWFIVQVFRYQPSFQPPNPAWYWAVRFFYTWYTFVAIGVAGIWVLVATFARTQKIKTSKSFYPKVSLIVPAYNEEKNIVCCIKSLYRTAEQYQGLCEIIVVDDGSSDYTYEVAWATIQMCRRKQFQVRGKVIRHTANQGKAEAIKTGVNSALGSFIAIVDADSWWMPDTLVKLADYLLSNHKKAVTGYVHPSDGDSELNPYVVLQQLEYSQGLGIVRNAQSMGNNVLVVSGAIGLYDADTLRSILDDKSIHSITEDLEITLEMHKKGAGVGYISIATSSSIVPHSFSVLWNQRLRWFSGWLHNTLRIHKDLLVKKSWLTLLLWYCYIFEYGGALVDLTAMVAFPFLFWFSPDPVLFAGSLLIFMPYSLLVGVINQTIALKFAYNQHNYRALLLYTPFYPIIRLINVFARLTSSVRFMLGSNGSWRHVKN